MKTVEQARENAGIVFGAHKASTIEALIDAKIAAAAQAEKDRRHAFLADVRAGTVDAFLPMETEGNPIDDLTCPHCAGSGHKGDVRATPEDTAKGGEREAIDDLIGFAITEALGERCATHDPDCLTCKAWAQYDAENRNIAEMVRQSLDKDRRIASLESTLAEKDRRIGELTGLLKRYRHETPLNHQPHMIAHLVEAALADEVKP